MPAVREVPDFDEEDFKRNQEANEEPVNLVEVSFDISSLPIGKQFEFRKFCLESDKASREQAIYLLKECYANLLGTQHLAGQMLVGDMMSNIEGMLNNLPEKLNDSD